MAYARFSPEKDVPLKEIKLTGGASIMANGKEMEYHYFDENTIFGYSYSLALGKDEQVSFVFQRKRQQETRMLTNYAYKEWINEIHIPSELTTIKVRKSRPMKNWRLRWTIPIIWRNIPLIMAH